MEPALSTHFECFRCHNRFEGEVYEIVRERSRLHFDKTVPYFESGAQFGLACYCSRNCLNASIGDVMMHEKVPITFPKMNRLANCAICRLSVDRTSFHRAYVATLSEPMDDAIWDTLEMDCLAIVCERCAATTWIREIKR